MFLDNAFPYSVCSALMMCSTLANVHVTDDSFLSCGFVSGEEAVKGFSKGIFVAFVDFSIVSRFFVFVNVRLYRIISTLELLYSSK